MTMNHTYFGQMMKTTGKTMKKTARGLSVFAVIFAAVHFPVVFSSHSTLPLSTSLFVCLIHHLCHLFVFDAVFSIIMIC